MGAFDRANEAKLLNSLSGAEEYEDEPTFIEQARAQGRITEREELSVSEHRNREASRRPRDAQMEADIANGTIPASVADMFSGEVLERRIPTGPHAASFGRHESRSKLSGRDYNAMAEHLNASGPHYYRTDKDLDEAIVTELRTKRAEDEEILESATGVKGFTAKLLGAGVAASIKDPINLMAMLVPGVAAKQGVSIVRTAGKAAMAAGGTNLATEGIIQSQVFAYKDTIDSPYEWTDALFNVGGALVFGAAIGGATGGLSQALTGSPMPTVTPEIEPSMAGADAPVVAPAQGAAVADLDIVTPEMRMEVDTEYATISTRAVVNEDGGVVSIRAEADAEQRRADELAEMAACMFGGAA